MKCVRCDTDNNLKDRTANAGRCKNCNHPFIFEPTSSAQQGLTDPMFKKTLNDLSVNDTLLFTRAQLRYALNRRLTRRRGTANRSLFISGTVFLVLAVLLGFIPGDGVVITTLLTVLSIILVTIGYSGLQGGKTLPSVRNQVVAVLRIYGFVSLGASAVVLLLQNNLWLFLIDLAVGVGSLFLANRALEEPQQLASGVTTSPVGDDQLVDWLGRWNEVNGGLKLLPAPETRAVAAAPSADVTAYSFDRVTVCESASVAQMLIANNFHFENNCAVVSIGGYPPGIFDTVIEMLRRNPDLKVYALHDASPRGVRLIHDLRTNPRWFPDPNIVIFDVGLTPRQVQKSVNAYIENSPDSAQAARALPEPVRSSLEAPELAWLEAGNFVALESLSPQVILQALGRAISMGRMEGDAADGGFIFIDGGTYYGTDSFG